MSDEQAISIGEIGDSISYLYGEGLYELRVPREIDGKRSATVGFFHLPKQLDKMAAAAAKYNDEHSVYITLNPISRESPLAEWLRAQKMRPGTMYDKKRGARDEDILARRWIGVDFDVVAPHDEERSASKEEVKSAERRAVDCCRWLIEQGIPRESLVLSSSGNGAHVMIRVDLPNDDASRDVASDILVVLNGLFGDEAIRTDASVFNAARIWKVYGSYARRGISDEEHPHRVARILQMPPVPEPCPAERLLPIAALAPKAPPGTQQTPYSGPDVQFDIKGFVDRHFPAHGPWHPYSGGSRCILNQCPFDPRHTGSSVAMLQLSRGGLYFDCKHDGCVSQGRNWQQVRALLEPRGTKTNLTVTPRTDGTAALQPLDDPEPEAMEMIRAEVAQAEVDARIEARPVLQVVDENFEPGDFRAAARMATRFTDVGNARLLVKNYGDDFLWCDTWERWLTWDETHWIIAGKAAIGLKGHALGDALQEDACERGETEKDAQHKWAQKTLSHFGQMNMIAEAKVLLEVNVANLDRGPHLFNLLNGTLNLKTGVLQPHRREDRLMRCAPVEYDPQAQCPLWLSCLLTWMDGDEEMVRYLQRLAGYFLCGETIEQCFWIFLGPGANGKGVFTETLLGIMGEYASSVNWATFASKQVGAQTYELASLKGKRLALTSEIDSEGRLNESLVKQVTGGDTIQVRQIYGEPFLLRPEFKIVMSTNHMPKIKNTDHGIWRRPKKVNWSVVIQHPDTLLTARLRHEWPGILRWMVDGFTAWQAGGIQHPLKVVEATDEYRREEDVLGRFIEDCCILRPDAESTPTGLFLRYQAWAEENGYGHFKMVKSTLGKRLRERGFEAHKRSFGMLYRGIGIAAQMEPPPEPQPEQMRFIPQEEGQDDVDIDG